MTRLLTRSTMAAAVLVGPLWALGAPAFAQDGPQTESGALLQEAGFALDSVPAPDGPQTASEAPAEPTTSEAAPSAGVTAEIDALRAEIAGIEERLSLLEQGRKAVSDRTVTIARTATAEARAELRRAAGDGRQTLFGDVEVRAGEVVEELMTISGDVFVRGTVTGDAMTVNGDVFIYEGGRVLGDAASMNGDVIIESNGVLEGEAHTLNGSLEVLPGGALHGATMPVPEPEVSWIGGLLAGLYRRLVFLLAFAGAGVLIVTLFQERVGRIAQYLEEEPAKAGLMGLAWSAGLILGSVLFFWTIFGPLAGAAVLGLAWMLGFVGLCQMLGDRLGLPIPYQAHGRWLAFLVGAVLVSFLGALPWLGILVVLAASVFGVGAALQTSFGSK